jgi:hypothetical protein
MKILIIGGMHGNEPLGISLVKMFQEDQDKDVDAVFANEKAIQSNCRFLEQDLNRSFPGNIRSKFYEEKRAAYLLSLCNKYKFVLDFHNTSCPNNDCSFIGKSANKNLFNLSAYLSLKKVIVADYDCINKYIPNCISVEISLDSKVMDVKNWYERISKLSKMNSVPFSGRVEKYRFVNRITLEDRDRLDLTKRKLKAFTPITKSLASSMGVNSPAFPVFINDSFTPYNYGGLLNKL